ncbi:MAG: hypothetical protein L6R42_007056, partial [Xanthoria sp. 1 TBL-2021]
KSRDETSIPRHPSNIMRAMKSLTHALKGKSRKSEKSSATSSKVKDELEIYGPMYERLDEDSYQLVNYLKPLYTDISFEDLTATANLLHGKSFTPEQVEYSFIGTCDSWKERAREGIVKFDLRSTDLDTAAPFLWLKSKNVFTGCELDSDYNKPFSTIARYRIDYEKAMARLGRVIPYVESILATSSFYPDFDRRDAAVHTRDRTADVERLSKPGHIDVQDLVDLSPMDLERIYDARETFRDVLRLKKKDSFFGNEGIFWETKLLIQGTLEQGGIMPSIKPFTSAWKGKSKKSEKSSTTESKPEDNSSKYECLPEPSCKSRVGVEPGTARYLVYLKFFYTDTTLENLTATLCHLHGTDFTMEEVSAFFTGRFDSGVLLCKAHKVPLKLPFTDVPSNAAYLFLSSAIFVSDETDDNYNEPIDSLAKFRVTYETAMEKLGKPTRSLVDNTLEYHRRGDIERLSKPGPIDIMDLRDLPPMYLLRIYCARERMRDEQNRKNLKEASDKM